jgi:hypothetical protein
MDEVLGLLSPTTSAVHAIGFDASGIGDVDYSAAKTLLQMDAELGRRGVPVTVVAASDDLRKETRATGPTSRRCPSTPPSMHCRGATLIPGRRTCWLERLRQFCVRLTLQRAITLLAEGSL